MSQEDNMLYDDLHSEYSDMDTYSVGTTDRVDRNYSGINFMKNGKFKSHNDYIEYEPGHYVVFRTINHKRVPVEIYMTKNQPGFLIRNAISGIRDTKYRVGKLDECLFFKVKLSDIAFGRELLKGRDRMHPSCRGQYDSYGVLFYDSPEEFERHFNLTLDQGLKEKWAERKLQYMQDIRGYEEEPQRDTMVIVH